MAVFHYRKGILVPESEQVREEETDRRKKLVTCTAPQHFHGVTCPTCRGRVIVHCDECKTPITSCKCDLKDRINSIKDQLIDTLYGNY